ncbi:MAG: penicillin-binding protein [Candidatus Nomurabacteria bacterium]|jgi:penicillin-binding protein 1A|nr:penicillin-binding protein [Candidatus Nomurabacteria bacterium]
MSKKLKKFGSVFRARSKSTSHLDPNSKKAKRLQKKRERLSHLPKSRIERYRFYLLHPRELCKFWFSGEGFRFGLKILLGLLILLSVYLLIFHIIPDIAKAKTLPDVINDRIRTTTNTYLDRNGETLWEDSGSGQVLKFVDSDQITPAIKDATVAIEDKEFFSHGGVSLSGIARSFVNNISGGATQGGSTLTQQLIKQVFFIDEAGERGLAGIPRKIDEAILAVEAERIYSKDEILTYYLNVAPYGGRRNGVQSAAETYFGKDASNLTLAESALLAAIPQSPTIYNPYNIDWNTSLMERQNTVLKYMGEQFPERYTAEMIAAAQEELTIDNLQDTLKPLDSLIVGARAPHFVQMVKSDLEDELGIKVVGQGGLVVKTTLDLRVQNIIDEEIDKVFAGNLPRGMGFDNAAATMVDSQTGQVLGMRGSRDYNFPDYGAVNAATSFIQPGSSVKPEVYASLIDMQRDGKAYGAGTMIEDTDGGKTVQQIYGAQVHNANGSTRGAATIRNGLSQSLNIPAIMAMHFNGGAQPTIEKMREIGDKSYCTDGVDQTVGLAASIGGCGAKQVEHANAFATFARMGTYRPVSSVLEVKDFQDNLLFKHDEERDVKQVIDPQSAFIINDVLSDANSRSATFGYCSAGFCIPGVKTASKTGTSDLGGAQKDLWFMSYTPKASFAMWWGNHVPAVLNYGDGMSLGPTVAGIVGRSHRDVFAPDGSWNNNDWFQKPEGIQTLSIGGRNDIYPSWYTKDAIEVVTEPTVFDRVSRKLATECTPDAARETLDVVKTVNNTRKSTTYQAPDGYDREHYDDVHSCGDSGPMLWPGINVSATKLGSVWEVSATIQKGNNARSNITTVTFSIDGQQYTATASALPNVWIATVPTPSGKGGATSAQIPVSIYVADEALYSSSTPVSVLFSD